LANRKALKTSALAFLKKPCRADLGADAAAGGGWFAAAGL